MARLHHRWFDYLTYLIGLHLIAVAFYFAFKRDNLIKAMITGKRRGPSGGAQMRPVAWWRFLAGAVVVTGIVYAISVSFYF